MRAFPYLPRCGRVLALAVVLGVVTAACEERGQHRADTPAVSACEHPFVPSRPGARLEYRWSSRDDEGTATLELLRVREQRGSATALWAVRSSSPAPSVVELERACDGRGVEEPWVGLGGGRGIELSGQTWRLPRDLAPGTQFGGTIDASIMAFAVTLERSHRVLEHEVVEVGGAAYDTLRVQIEERTVAAAEPAMSTAWIARDVGLVRFEARGPDGARSTLELSSARVAGL